MAILAVARSNSEKELMVRLMREYQAVHGEGPMRFPDVAVWALNNKRWNPPRRSLVSDLKKRLSRAARLRHHTDAQGRRVRTMHAARYSKLTENGQMVFETMWDELETMSADHARVSFTQRLDQIGGECQSLHRDNMSYADNNPNADGKPVQMSFNFEHVKDEDFVQEVDEIPDISRKPNKPR